MMAASLGAAETAFVEFQKGIPDMMVMYMNWGKIIEKIAETIKLMS